MALPSDTCLQCEQSRAEVKANVTICGIEDGYEYRELVAEWPRHHWRDWSDAELQRFGIKPEFYGEHRRDPISYIVYSPCDHIERGHSFPKEDIYIEKWLMHEKDVCMTCGKRKDTP